MSETFDLVITGGKVVDGTGEPAFAADVGVRDGRVVAIEPGLSGGARTLDAEGRVVCPGFVDIHTHYDAQIFWDRMLSVSPWHGVTSAVMGNCGFGLAPTRPEHGDLMLRTLENVEGMSIDALTEGVGKPWPFETFPEFLDVIEERGVAIHVAALVGHTPVRMYVMGEASTEREATADEVAQMKEIVAEALASGAIGFATSKAPTHVGYDGRPVPSREASLEEIETLASCLADVDHGVMQATLGAGFFHEEFTRIAKRTGKPISWTALLGSTFGPEGHRGILAEAEKLQKEGLQIFPQVTCRPLLFEFQWKAPFPFEMLPMFQVVSEADFEGKKRLYADPTWRKEFREREEPSGFGVRWDRTVISECATRPELNETPLVDAAREAGVHPADFALDLGLETNLELRLRSAIANAEEHIVAELLTHPAAMLGLSDAGAHATQLCDAGFSTHLLGHWVREKRVLTLEAAVRLLTSRSADVFGLHDRGRLQVGRPADIVVFDPETVACGPLQRVRDLPGGADRLTADAHGIDAVIVEGVVIRQHGKDQLDPNGPLPGRVLRGGRA